MSNKIKQFFQASEQGKLDELLTLIQSGVNVNTRDEYGYTALMWATISGHSACIHVLIEAGTDVNAHTNNGWTALILAAVYGHSACIHILIEAGAYVNAHTRIGTTALMEAACKGHSACISMLIEAGADIHSLDNTHINKLIKNNIYTIDVLRNTAFNRRKNALLFYKTQYLDNY